MRHAAQSSWSLGKVTRPGALVEHGMSPLAKLPYGFGADDFAMSISSPSAHCGGRRRRNECVSEPFRSRVPGTAFHVRSFRVLSLKRDRNSTIGNGSILVGMTVDTNGVQTLTRVGGTGSIVNNAST